VKEQMQPPLELLVIAHLEEQVWKEHSQYGMHAVDL
jgi:hypothetical protein